MPGMNPLGVLALVFSSVTAVLLVITGIMVQRTRRRLAGTVRVPGTILSVRGDIRTRRDSERGLQTYRVRLPTLVYTDPSTESEHTFESGVHTGLPIGAKLPLAVRPGIPGTARVATVMALWAGQIVLGVITCFFLVASIGMLIGALQS
jgi:hypothetical protein